MHNAVPFRDAVENQVITLRAAGETVGIILEGNAGSTIGVTTIGFGGGMTAGGGFGSTVGTVAVTVAVASGTDIGVTTCGAGMSLELCPLVDGTGAAEPESASRSGGFGECEPERRLGPGARVTKRRPALSLARSNFCFIVFAIPEDEMRGCVQANEKVKEQACTRGGGSCRLAAGRGPPVCLPDVTNITGNKCKAEP